MTMPSCSIRMKDGNGPWLPCPHTAVMMDPDGDPLCENHLEMLWFCERGWFNIAGNGMLCPACQAEAATEDGGLVH